LSHKGIIGITVVAAVIVLGSYGVFNIFEEDKIDEQIPVKINTPKVDDQLNVIDEVEISKQRKGADHYVTIIDGIRATDPTQ